jgi:hypothetical protein
MHFRRLGRQSETAREANRRKRKNDTIPYTTSQSLYHPFTVMV